LTGKVLAFIFGWASELEAAQIKERTRRGKRSQFNEYLRLVGIRHITASPFHPQTNGEIERYHRTIKGEMNQLPYEMPGDLREVAGAFIAYYNYRRYHEGRGNVTPYDVYTGKQPEIIRKRREAKSRTLAAIRDYNKSARNQSNSH
jgi:transposase InsO family protein